MIKKYNNEAAYNAAGYPTTESRVAEIEDTHEVKIDGVNVKTKTPVIGDAVYKDATGYHFFKAGEGLNHQTLLANGYTDVGQVIGWQNDKVCVIDKNITSIKYLSVWQYAITAISSTNITIGLWMKGDFANRKDTEITLSSTAIGAATAQEITDALDAAGNTGNIGYAKHGYWAYYDEDNNRIVVQCDFTEDYRQHQCYGSGCTIALCVWEDMPENSTNRRRNGHHIYWGIMNVEKGAAYYGVNGRTPTSNWTYPQSDLVTKAAFQESPYCANLREMFATYEDYIHDNMIMTPQKYGVLALPHGKELTNKYGNRTTTLKNGTVVFKFPALHYPLTLGYGVSGIDTGDFYLSGVQEGVVYMEDTNMRIINSTRKQMGHALLTKSSYRWFSQRSTANSAWFFNGSTGILYGGGVVNGYLVQGVALLNP